jgi:hypothetical protein
MAGQATRGLARDLLLDGLDDARVAERFEVRGFERLEEARAERPGVILVGSHTGAYIPAIHWLYRQGLPLRLLVQRPAHVSRYLQMRFDRAEGPFPQHAFFLKRNLAPHDAAERVLRARSALCNGFVLYLCGDIPAPAQRLPRSCGRAWPFRTLWADLAASTGADVVTVFAWHRPNGNYRVVLDPPFRVEPGKEEDAVRRYLSRLSQFVRDEPEQAVAYWTWPGYREVFENRLVFEVLERLAPSTRDREACMAGGRRLAPVSMNGGPSRSTLTLISREWV